MGGIQNSLSTYSNDFYLDIMNKKVSNTVMYSNDMVKYGINKKLKSVSIIITLYICTELPWKYFWSNFAHSWVKIEQKIFLGYI